MPTLYVLQGPDKGGEIRTVDDVVVIGRGSDQVHLTDHTVSRRHAELRSESGVWTITDLNSANGTYLNGVRVQKTTKLKHGDQLRVGGTLLVYGGDESIEQVSGLNIPRDLINLDAAAVDASVVASLPSNEDSVILAAPDTAYAVKSWKAVRELTDVIGSLISSDQLLPRVMDILFEQLPVDRGIVFIRDEETRELIPQVVRFLNRKSRAEASRDAVSASRTIMNYVVETHEGVLSSNVVSDERFRSGKSVQDLGMRSVICVPIMARERVLGVIHLDCPVSRHTYNEHELRLVIAVGNQTGLAIENARLVQAQLERERLAAVGETVSFLAHSIKNILQGMLGGADVVQRGIDKEDWPGLSKGWRILKRNVDKCDRLMRNMLTYSKQREPMIELRNVNKLVEEVVELAQGQADEAHIVLLSERDDDCPPIPVDYDGLFEALLNLVSNAVDAAPRETGLINVRSEFDPVERRVWIRVRDNGPGVPEAERLRIFEPFHSTKGQAGTGLGLAAARKVVREMGGDVSLACPQDGGAEFSVWLPTADARRRSPGDTQGPQV